MDQVEFSLHKTSFSNLILNLSYDGGFTDLIFDGGGGAQSAPPIFICEDNRTSNKIMHCVEIFF